MISDNRFAERPPRVMKNGKRETHTAPADAARLTGHKWLYSYQQPER